MKNMTKNTKKNILEYNNNNTLKSDLNKRKYLLYTIVASIYFIIIYFQFITFHQQFFVEVNAEISEQKANSKYNLYCAVVIDAGSTGSRILATAFNKIFIDKPLIARIFCCYGFSEKYSYFKLNNYIFQRTEGGLSHYIDDKQKREEIIRNLLEHAKDFMKKNPGCGRTPLIFRATAGLRLLNAKADEIIDQVKIIVNEYSSEFQVDELNSVAIMDGSDEGLFAWFTVNYLLDTLKDFNNTTAVLDLGGGSLQITHYLPNYDKVYFKYSYKARYIKSCTISGVQRYFYNQSFLGFGLIGVRTKIFNPIDENNELNVESPCHHTSSTFSYTFNSKTYSVTGKNNSTLSYENYNKCWDAIQPIVVQVVKVRQNVNSLKKVTAISFFYDRALDAKLIDDESTIPINRFNEAAKDCFNNDFDESNPFKCVDLIYIYILLQQGFGFSGSFSISFEKYIDNFELSWALGAAYENLIDEVET